MYLFNASRIRYSRSIRWAVGESNGPDGARRRTYDLVGVLSRYVGFDCGLARPLRQGTGGESYLTEFELLDFERTLITLDVLFEIRNKLLER